MTLQNLGNIGEFISAIAVVASLLYLARQIRQNSKLLRAAAMQSVTTEASTSLSSIAQDASTAGVLIRGMADYGSLSPEEQSQFAALLFLIFNSVQYSYSLHNEELIPTRTWEQSITVARFYLATPGVRTWWKTLGNRLVDRDFASFLEEQVLPDLENG